MKVVSSIGTGVLASLVAAWIAGFLDPLLPSADRSWLALRNVMWGQVEPVEGKFRIVLCWLENDDTGRDTDNVEDAFVGVDGVTLLRSARVVSSPGARDDWYEATKRSAQQVLEDWKGDLAIFGVVKKPGEVLSLWFVPRSGDGTLERGDRPYRLVNVTLGSDFHDDLRAQITIRALEAVSQFAYDEILGGVLEDGLLRAAESLSKLLRGRTIVAPKDRAELNMALADALLIVGQRQGDSGVLLQALDAYSEAVDLFTSEGDALERAQALAGLGGALAALGAREDGAERLMQAVDALEEAHEVFARERARSDWASTTLNLATTLMLLADRENSQEYLERSVEVYRVALTAYTRTFWPLGWAKVTHDLGSALIKLGEREDNTEHILEAVELFDASLEERSRERVPFDWASTQHSLGIAYSALGIRDPGTDRLVQAVVAFRSALEVITRKSEPLEWSTTQYNLGLTLFHLGSREGGTEHLEQAVEALDSALEEFTREGDPLSWAETSAARGDALLQLAGTAIGVGVDALTSVVSQSTHVERYRMHATSHRSFARFNFEQLRKAVDWRETSRDLFYQAIESYRMTLDVITRKNDAPQWATIQHNLGNALSVLGGMENQVELLQQAVRAYRASLEVYTRENTPFVWDLYA